MSDSGRRLRRLVFLAFAVGVAVLAVRRYRERRDVGAVDADDSPDGEVSVELDRVSVGENLSIATGDLDPTVAAEVLELNVQALETVEEAWVRDTVNAALAEDADLETVEEQLSEQVRENEVTDTAIDELEALGFRGLLDFGGGRDGGDAGDR